MINTIKYSLWVVQTCTQQIQDGERPPFWKKIEKSLYLVCGLTDRHEIWHHEAKWLSEHDWSQKFEILRNQDGRRPPSWKPENRDILVMVLPIDVKFGTITLFTLSAVEISNFYNSIWRTAAMLRIKKCGISVTLCLTDNHEIRQGNAKALNRPCAAAMRPFVKLLWPLVIIACVRELASLWQWLDDCTGVKDMIVTAV